MAPYRQAREKSGEHLYSDETGCELSQLRLRNSGPSAEGPEFMERLVLPEKDR